MWARARQRSSSRWDEVAARSTVEPLERGSVCNTRLRFARHRCLGFPSARLDAAIAWLREEALSLQ